MKTLLAALVAAVLLSACAPGAYTVRYLERNGGERPAANAQHVERPEREPEVGHPTIPLPTPEPPVVRPDPPAPPAGPPPTPELPADPHAGCRVKEMPPRSAVERIVKCPGQPAIVIKRP